MALRVGLISDTHGVLHPAVTRVFARVDHILHTGDIGSPDVLAQLERLAPVTAISGNADRPPLSRLPRTRCVELGGVRILLVHQGVERGRPTVELEVGLRRYRPAVAVYGHSHVASVVRRADVLLVNPGGGGRRRFHLPRSVAVLTLGLRDVRARLWWLDARPTVSRGRREAPAPRTAAPVRACRGRRTPSRRASSRARGGD
ncbi:MAG TPA: metallophosphoesterase family protein [Candidatus Binatus sp.]|nr:metallophosphoesterase family protein [Candidatus Binatus sp.]